MATRVYDKVIYKKAQTSQVDTQAITADRTLAADEMGGLYTISGSSAVTVTVPDPSLCAGTTITFKCASDQAHILSGNAGGDTFSTSDVVVSSTGDILTFANDINSSAVLMSDGTRYLVIAHSGTLAYS